MSACLYQKVHIVDNDSVATFSFTDHDGGLIIGFSKTGDLLVANHSAVLSKEAARALLRTLAAMIGGA